MNKKLLKGAQILAVDDEVDVLKRLEEALTGSGAILDAAASYEEAVQKISSYTYGLVVLDLMGGRGLDLLQLAVVKNVPVVVLTAHEANAEVVNKSVVLGARGYLITDELNNVPSLLEGVLRSTNGASWKRGLERAVRYLAERFGQEKTSAAVPYRI
jgi:DNA-binding NtrC family response regulator